MIKGDVLMLQNPPMAHEAMEMYQSAVRGGRAAGMHTVELEAMNRLVATQRAFGETPDSTDELRAVYESFTEGLDELPMVTAHELLES
jgi:hypothetical protein